MPAAGQSPQGCSLGAGTEPSHFTRLLPPCPDDRPATRALGSLLQGGWTVRLRDVEQLPQGMHLFAVSWAMPGQAAECQEVCLGDTHKTSHLLLSSFSFSRFIKSPPSSWLAVRAGLALLRSAALLWASDATARLRSCRPSPAQ